MAEKAENIIRELLPQEEPPLEVMQTPRAELEPVLLGTPVAAVEGESIYQMAQVPPAELAEMAEVPIISNPWLAMSLWVLEVQVPIMEVLPQMARMAGRPLGEGPEVEVPGGTAETAGMELLVEAGVVQPDFQQSTMEAMGDKVESLYGIFRVELLPNILQTRPYPFLQA
jgi:hypothetical protein